MPRLFLALAAALMIATAACGGGASNGDQLATALPDGQSIVPVPGNSELVVGPNRFALALIGEDNRPILDESLFLRFFFGEELKAERQASFTWAIPDANGFYVANVDFDTAGQWTVEAVLTRDGKDTTTTFTFPVREEGVAPTIGEPAPPSTNLTLSADPNIKKVSTDQEPEPALYETTVADAVTLGKPLVVVFATPAFCQTQFCGPVLDNVKAVRRDFIDDVTFIHIEPFVLDDEGQLVIGDTGAPGVAQPMLDWNLQTEPWVFIIDAGGIISARFEGAASPGELKAAIEAVVG